MIKPFKKVPRNQWRGVVPNALFEVYQSDEYLVQIHKEPTGIRLTICSTFVTGFNEINGPIWKEGISWDDLQSIKDAVGFEDQWFVELYPPKEFIVNEANMRHLWIIDKPDFGWEPKY